MRRGQYTFQPDIKEGRHICCSSAAMTKYRGSNFQKNTQILIGKSVSDLLYSLLTQVNLEFNDQNCSEQP